MKHPFIFLFVLFSLPLFSQTITQNTTFFGKDSTALDGFKFSFDLYDYDFSKKEMFTVYNPATELTDHYIQSGENYYYKKSIFVFDNTFFGRQLDSLNPNGAHNFGSAIVLGVLNTIFQ